MSIEWYNAIAFIVILLSLFWTILDNFMYKTPKNANHGKLVCNTCKQHMIYEDGWFVCGCGEKIKVVEFENQN